MQPIANLEQTIVDYGAKAVTQYREIAGLAEDTGVPEIFLGGIIASGIYKDLGYHAHVELPYTTIVANLGLAIDVGIINRFGSKRADVAVYIEGRPVAIIELKKYDDYVSASTVVADRDKIQELSALCHINGYLGVFITDTKVGHEIRKQRLVDKLGSDFGSVSDARKAVSGKWHWIFAAMQVC